MQAEYDLCQGINEALCAFARGEAVDYRIWPEILDQILKELDRVARTEFPIPNLPPPNSSYHNAPLADFMSDFSFSSNSTSSSAPSSPFSHVITPPSGEDDKYNAAYSAHMGSYSAGAAAAFAADNPAEAVLPGLVPMLDSESESESGSGSGSGSEPALALPPSPPAVPPLPAQIEDMLDEITATLRTFFAARPPHTIQRLAELILAPHANYRSLAPYLAAVDKVVHVSSGLDAYPLPLAATEVRISDGDDPTGAVSWANPAGPAAAAGGPALGAGPVLADVDMGFDEVLGGALLSPIPWLRERSSSEEYEEEGEEDEDGFFGEAMSAPPGTITTARGAHLRSESTVTVDGPNGMGRIETVSVSINGLPCVGTSALLTGRHFYHHQMQHVIDGEDDAAGEDDDDDEALYPHLRAPVQVGADDLGPQRQRRYFDGQAGSLVSLGDLEAPVGRQPNISPASSPEIGGSDEGDDEGDEGEDDDEDEEDEVDEDDDEDEDEDDPDLDAMDLDLPELPGMLDREGGRDPVPVSSPPSSGSESSEDRWR